MKPCLCFFHATVFGGKQVKGKSDLLRVLDDYGVGDQVSLTIRRGSETLEATLPLEEADM
jgi:S1-C subfamily serine protease